MSFVNGVASSPVNRASLMQMSNGPSDAVSTARQTLVSTVGRDIVQQLGQQFGLPKSEIDTATKAFTAASGNPGARNLDQAISGLSDAIGFKGAAAGQFQREAKGQIQDFMKQQIRQSTKDLMEGLADTVGDQKKGKNMPVSKGGSVLLRIANALGSALDQKVDKMASNADKLAGLGEVSGDQKSSQYQQLSAEMNALGQELKIVGEALNNVIKSIGDTGQTLARK